MSAAREGPDRGDRRDAGECAGGCSDPRQTQTGSRGCVCESGRRLILRVLEIQSGVGDVM